MEVQGIIIKLKIYLRRVNENNRLLDDLKSQKLYRVVKILRLKSTQVIVLH